MATLHSLLSPPAPRLAPDPPRRPALDLESLAAFDKALASKAMALMFSGGSKVEAMRWLDRLDPLARAEHAPMGLRLLGYAGECSMADWAIVTGDLDSFKVICQSETVRLALFEKRAESMANYCSAAMGVGREDIADFLLSQMAPLPPEGKSLSARSPHGWSSLVEAAAKARRLDWLERALELQALAGFKNDEGWELARKYFVPEPEGLCKEGWFEPGVGAMVKAGAVSRFGLARLARAYAKMAPPNWARVDETLAECLAAIERDACAPYGQRHSAQKERHELFYWSDGHPRDTPPEWVSLMIGHGVLPFPADPEDSLARRPALELFSAQPRSHASRLASEEEREASRRSCDEKTRNLLAAMIESGAPGADHHYSLQDDRLKGARKISLVALAAVEGYWECAELLVSAGADPKPAARQISAHMPAGPAKAKAEAFFEALALRKVSSKASLARDKRSAKKGVEPQPEAPARAMRL